MEAVDRLSCSLQYFLVTYHAWVHAVCMSVHRHIPHLAKFYFVPILVRRKFRRFREALHRMGEMSHLLAVRKRWIEDQSYLMHNWLLSGGSRVTRAVEAAHAFTEASGVRKVGVQGVPVPSIAHTMELDDSDDAASTTIAELSTLSRSEDMEPLLGEPTASLTNFSSLQQGSSLADMSSMQSLGLRRAMALKGTAFENVDTGSVNVSSMGGPHTVWCRQDMERYRWRQQSEGGALSRAGNVTIAPETFLPEAYKPLRFRTRTLVKAAVERVSLAVKSATTFKIANWLQKREDSRRMEKFAPPQISALAAKIGGDDWLRTDLDRVSYLWVRTLSVA